MANAIASIARRPKSTTALKASFANLLCSRATKADDANHGKLENSNGLLQTLDKFTLQSELHRRLWTLAQLSVFDPSAARKLKPLKLPLETTQSTQSLQPEMLDRSPSPNLPAVPSPQASSSSISQTEDTILFSDEDCGDTSLLDEMEFSELAGKDEDCFHDLFQESDQLDEVEAWDPCSDDDEIEELLDNGEAVEEEDEMMFSENEMIFSENEIAD